jgi:diguanylate cyclase (GGDEF)-like protein
MGVGAESLAWAVGELAEMSTAEFDVDEMLRRLCEVAAHSLEVDGVGVMKRLDGDTKFVHVSDPQLADLERLQEVLQAGPCQDAINSRMPVAAGSVADMAWPDFERLAADTGIQAVLAVPLLSRNQVWGTLDLYWRAEHAVTDADRASAQMLANVAVSYLAMARDRAQSQLAQEQLARQALHDQLTGLPNRGLMQELITHALAASDRRGTVVAVLFVDLDRFKSINDTFGHQAGDQVLQVVAQRMQNALRAGDTVGRLSGDEFLILCEDIGDHAAGQQVLTVLGDRVRAAVSERIRVNLTDVSVAASIGIAVTADRPSAVEMIHSADLAMYEAKAAGRNRVVLHRHAPQTGTSQWELERQFLRAVEGDELRVHYQPIVARPGTVIAVEALLRWQHPTRGLLDAATFIELAEFSGSIVPIGQWLIRQAMQQLSTWIHQDPATAPQLVFCNFSPQQLLTPNVSEFLAQALAEFGLAPGQLGIEILEADLADQRLIDVLTTLQRSGHPLAVDDFGTGYSSLSRLIELPVAYVKIDRSVVSKLPEDPRARALIKAIVALAADLDVTVISEGIENHAQATYLQKAGTHLLQGFFLGRPMPAAELTAVLQGQSAENTAQPPLPDHP